ncbi:MAG TPA: hypothetical protein VMF55_01835 [Solirubrobacterales bacterium]|nr:hypothetical protein [Solirubrobacterales bacterium]
MAKKMRLSWFLVKPGLEDDVTAVIEHPSGGKLQSFKISALNPDRDSLYVKPSHASGSGMFRENLHFGVLTGVFGGNLIS